MADVAGFRALGYVPAKVSLDKVLASAELESASARALALAADPHNVMHLMDPAQTGASPVARWLSSGILAQQAGRAMYRYHQEFTLPELGGRTLVRRSLLCGVRIPSLADGGIKLHQAARPVEVDGHARATTRHHLHAAPALAAFRDPSFEVDRLFRRAETAPPVLQLQTPDGVWHRLWRCADAEVIGQVRNLFKPRKLYALDGHERLAGMLAAGEAMAQPAGMPMYAAGNYVLMSLVNLEDQSLLPAPCHRLVAGPPMSAAEVLAKAARYFAVQPLPGLAASPSHLAKELDSWTSTQACFALVFPAAAAGAVEAWQLTLLPAVNPRDEGVMGHPAVTRLDPVVIEDLFFRKVLGQPSALFSPSVAGPAKPSEDADVTSGPGAAPGAERPVPVTIVHTAASALAAITSRGPEAPWMAIMGRAVPMQQVVHVADLGQTLPAGSTHFYPPVLGGMAMLALTADEDLV
ncbi:MAG: DUF1015 family protein [Myxococcales bacterium]|nr:DUF1015 family protein [Myxococcales bacterium]